MASIPHRHATGLNRRIPRFYGDFRPIHLARNSARWGTLEPL
jgi:hypothetical protein